MDLLSHSQLLEAIQEIDLQHELRGFLIRENILHTSPRGGSEPLKLHDYSTYSQREGPVRLEMMKALARKWKLHFQPGFWRKHENRRDLMHALIAHGRNLYEKQEGEGKAATAGHHIDVANESLTDLIIDSPCRLFPFPPYHATSFAPLMPCHFVVVYAGMIRCSAS